MKRARILGGVAAVAVAMAGCVNSAEWHGRPMFAPQATAGAEETALRDAGVAHIAGGNAATPARVVRAYQWRPVPQESMVVWLTCRGNGDARACVLSAGRLRDGRATVVGWQNVGWSQAVVGDTANPSELVIEGDDGHGTWRQALRYEADGASVHFDRRYYSDGP